MYVINMGKNNKYGQQRVQTSTLWEHIPYQLIHYHNTDIQFTPKVPSLLPQDNKVHISPLSARRAQWMVLIYISVVLMERKGDD